MKTTRFLVRLGGHTINTRFFYLGKICVICGFGIIIILAFRPNFKKLYELSTHYSHLKQKLILEEKRNHFLKKESNGLSNDPGYIEKVAREKLGWCRPAETVYRFQTHSISPSSSDSK